MSFAFMPVYTGDYLRDTQHLSCSEHGIYFKLLMHCWDQRGPAPWDERKLAGIVNARSTDEVEALRRVLAEFFVRMDDGWYNRRMMREVEKAAALSDKKSTAGKLGAAVTNSRKRKDIPARARHLPGTSSADARQEPHTPTPTLTTTTTTTTRKNKGARPPFVLPDWISVSTWADFEEMRGKIRHPLTDAARALNIGKLEKLRDKGFDPKEVLEEAIANSWTGIWEPKFAKRTSRHSPTGEHMANVAQDWINSSRETK